MKNKSLHPNKTDDNNSNPFTRFATRTGATSRFNIRHATSGKIGYALLWLIGVPLPILAIIYFLRG